MEDFETTINLNIRVTISSNKKLEVEDLINIVNELDYDISSDDEAVNYMITNIEGFSV